MNNNIIIDEALAPFSKWINKTFFKEQFDRTLSQKAEDDWGIPKPRFHALVFGGLTLAALWYFNSE